MAVYCHEEVFLSLQPMIPSKRFDIFPLTGGGMLIRSYRLENKERYYDIVLKRSTFTFYNKSVVTYYHVILFSTVHNCVSHYVCI